jgi:hypothetical protein
MNQNGNTKDVACYEAVVDIPTNRDQMTYRNLEFEGWGPIEQWRRAISFTKIEIRIATNQTTLGEHTLATTASIRGTARATQEQPGITSTTKKKRRGRRTP